MRGLTQKILLFLRGYQLRIISLFLLFSFSAFAQPINPNWFIVLPWDGKLYTQQKAPSGAHSIQKADGSYLDPEVCVLQNGVLVEDATLKAAKAAAQAQIAQDAAFRANQIDTRLNLLKTCVAALKAGTITNNQRDTCLLKVIQEAVSTRLSISEL